MNNDYYCPMLKSQCSKNCTFIKKDGSCTVVDYLFKSTHDAKYTLFPSIETKTFQVQQISNSTCPISKGTCSDECYMKCFEYNDSAGECLFRLFLSLPINTKNSRQVNMDVSDDDNDFDDDDDISSNENSYNLFDKQSDEAAAVLLAKPRDVLMEEMRGYLIKSTELVNGKLRELYMEGRDYFRNNGIRALHGVSDKHRYALLDIRREVYNKYKEDTEEAYYNNIMSFISECVATVKNKKKITKPEIDIFFKEKSMQVPGPIKEMFRTKVNQQLANN